MEFTHNIKARTGLQRIQVSMPYDQGLGELPMQFTEQIVQGLPLGYRPGVHGSLAIAGESSDVAYPDTVPVVVPAVGTHLFDGSAFLDRTIGRNDEVISASFPAERAMPAVDVRHPQGAALPVGRAMHDDQRDGSHPIKPLAAPPAAPVITSSTIRMM